MSAWTEVGSEAKYIAGSHLLSNVLSQIAKMTCLYLLPSLLAAAVFLASASASEQATPQKCAAGLGRLGYSPEALDRYGEFFGDSSVMILAEAGTYVGSSAIEEYASFATASSPYMASARSVARDLAFTGVDPGSGLCTFRTIAAIKFTTNPDLAVPATFTVVIAQKLEYDAEAHIIRTVYVYFSKPFIAFFFGTIVNTRQTAEFICGVLATQCRPVFDLNALKSAEECEENMGALPAVSPGGYADGYDFACRALHAAFAATNPSHCPHLSFAPVADANRFIKCQKSALRMPLEFFSDSELAVVANFSASVGIDAEQGFRVSCEDSDLWVAQQATHQSSQADSGCGSDCRWVAEDPSSRCLEDGALYACAATCLPDCKVSGGEGEVKR